MYTGLSTALHKGEQSTAVVSSFNLSDPREATTNQPTNPHKATHASKDHDVTQNPSVRKSVKYVGREPRWATAAPPSPGAQRVSVALPSLTTSTTTAQEGQGAPHLATTSGSDKNNSVANITGQLGGSAFLPCTTHHSMERQVGHPSREEVG
ncbi:hypothetical protein Pmani_038032 [Petrolisthes manimaculis]|uniref:Uncharacterized protein n=1 Tax=Petrolisthes manimaculis TaxID=1843537 RepID=A0AAE1NH16_9EUCA|nr:hypothetical protein Pmani_038032 [Petrolisthes manimaculis]